MRFTALAVSIASMCSLLAVAQVGPGLRGPVSRAAARAFGLGFGQVVLGAPYTATVTNTNVHSLSDGNSIQRTTSGTVARDSQGRTYSTEMISGMFGQSGTKTITFIADPVAGYVYTLHADTKTAIRRPFPASSGSDSANWLGSKEPASNPNVASQDLGFQVVNGLNAQGKNITRTIPAGTIGNEKPIVSKTQVWYSPDLQVVVSSVRSDPREGNSTYALTNIQRIEPAPALFQVPSDYTVKDAPSFGPRP